MVNNQNYIDFDEYNKPPFFPGWASGGELLELAKTPDKQLGELCVAIDTTSDLFDDELLLDNDALLDRRGRLLGIERQGSDNETYLKQQKLRMLLNLNRSTIPDIIKILKTYYSAEVIHIVPRYPAGITILHDGLSPIGVDFNSFIVETIGAGIAFETRELYVYNEKLNVSDNRLFLKIYDYDEIHYNGRFMYNGAVQYGNIFWVHKSSGGLEQRDKSNIFKMGESCNVVILENGNPVDNIIMED